VAVRTATYQLALVIAMVVVALVALACGGEESVSREPKTFSDDRYPFTFTYPGDLDTDDVTIPTTSGDTSGRTSTGLGLDPDNGLVVTRYPTLDVALTARDMTRVIAQLDKLVSEGTGNPISGTLVDVGGFPGVLYDNVEISEPPSGRTRMVFLFEGDDQYSIHCQSTPDRRQQVIAACDQALTTLRHR
jgi:hypothetical protein